MHVVCDGACMELDDVAVVHTLRHQNVYADGTSLTTWRVFVKVSFLELRQLVFA